MRARHVATFVVVLLAMTVTWLALASVFPDDESRRVRLIARVEPSVVVVLVEKQQIAHQGQAVGLAPSQGLGTGVVLTADGLILTAAHVVADASRIGVKVLARDAVPDSMPVERPPTVGADTTTRLRHLADGSLEWTPEPSDSAALGTILHAPEGGTPHAVRVARAEGKGLGLEVAGHAVLVLDETFDDVQVEAQLDATGFAGEVGLVHHAQDASNACVLVVSSEGRAGLRVRSQGVETELDAAPAALPGHVFTLAVSSAGGHQKGMIEGKTVVHGHREPGSPGRVGVVVNGRGTVRILALRVVPLARGQG